MYQLCLTILLITAYGQLNPIQILSVVQQLSTQLQQLQQGQNLLVQILRISPETKHLLILQENQQKRIDTLKTNLKILETKFANAIEAQDQIKVRLKSLLQTPFTLNDQSPYLSQFRKEKLIIEYVGKEAAWTQLFTNYIIPNEGTFTFYAQIKQAFISDFFIGIVDVKEIGSRTSFRSGNALAFNVFDNSIHYGVTKPAKKQIPLEKEQICEFKVNMDIGKVEVFVGGQLRNQVFAEMLVQERQFVVYVEMFVKGTSIYLWY